MKLPLVRLYPSRWRDRYGDEFEYVLEQRPQTFSVLLDVLLGAVDAHLTADSPERRGWWMSRLPALVIAFGALIWAGGAAAFYTQGPDLSRAGLLVMALGQLAIGLAILGSVAGSGRPSILARLIEFVVGVSMLAYALVLTTYFCWIEGVPWFVSQGAWGTAPIEVHTPWLYVVLIVWCGSELIQRLTPHPPLFALALASAILLIADGPGYPLGAVPFLALPVCWLGLGMALLFARRSNGGVPTDPAADESSVG
jgi:hypothetical protein